MSYDVETDVAYATIGDETLLLDIYRPTSVADAPTVLYFHGGGFAVGDKADLPDRMTRLAAAGVAVVSANYRLAPHTFPTPIHDAKAAMRWIRARGAEHGLNVERVGVWGASAGGYIAAMLALTANDDELEGEVGDATSAGSHADAAVVWFAPGDMVASSARSWLEQLVLGDPPAAALFGRPIVPVDEEVLRNSPAARAHSAAPPFLIQAGDRDRVVSEADARSLHDALVRAGASSVFHVVGGAGHESESLAERANIAAIAAWLRAHLSADH